MARISRRYVIHAVSASVLVTALALPAGTAVAAAGPRSPDGGTVEAPVRSTEPPPSDPDDPGGPTTTPPADPTTDPGRPDDGPSTSPASPPDGTSEDYPSPTSGETGGQVTEPPPGQETETDGVVAALTEEKDRVPGELAPAVDTLIDIVGALDTPGTLPQDRQGVVESAENLSTALAAVTDPRTPPELREQLTAIVKQVTATLEAAHGAGAPAEEQSLFILVVKRTTSTLDIICAPGTPEELRGRLVAVVGDTNYALESSRGRGVTGSAGESQSPDAGGGTNGVRSTAMLLGSSSDIIHDRRVPQKEREELAEVTQQVSSLLKKITDPGTSQKKRSEAEEDLEDRTARMKDQQEESASAREGPKESLGKAAAVCASAIFESTPESTLRRGLKELVPAAWRSEGVKDFWKAVEKTDDRLDVLAQLRSDERSEAPFEVVPLITALAELVPRDMLFGSMGGSSFSCEETAEYLDERFGVTVGSWLAESGG